MDSMQKESPIESGPPRAGRLSKDRNEDQTSSRTRRSPNYGNGNSHQSSVHSLGTLQGAHSDYSRDEVALHSGTDFEYCLPQPAEDDTISRELRILFYYVAQHVSTFYMNEYGDIVPRKALVSLEYLHSPLLSSTVDEVLEDTRCPQAIIEHCLNHMLLSSILTNFGSQQVSTGIAYESPRYPLLPAMFTAIPEASARSSMAPRNEKCQCCTLHIIFGD